MRRWLLVLIPLLFVAPAHTQSNPTPDPTCGLPKGLSGQNTIVESVVYTLKADCTQAGFLHIRTGETPNVRLEINGNGKTIFNGGSRHLFNFLVVDDEGAWGDQLDPDQSESANVQVIIKNVTFDGNNKPFETHRTCPPDGDCGWHRWPGYGAGILAEGSLTMENVTFKNGNGIWLMPKGTATLTNVLFEDSYIHNVGASPNTKGILMVPGTGKVTLHNAMFRDNERASIAIWKGGRLTTTGCLSFVRVLTHIVHDSALDAGLGTWSDSSTGDCTGPKIGNGDPVADGYTLPMLDCDLPSSGAIEGTVVYSLKKDCVCVSGKVKVTAGASVTINGNGFQIVGCSGTSAGFQIGDADLTINSARLNGMRVHNYGGMFTLRNSRLTETSPGNTPIINYGWSYLLNNVFENNVGDNIGEGNVYYSHGWFGIGKALFRDNTFRNNGPTAVEAFTEGGGTAIYVCGENEFDRAAAAAALPPFLAVDGGGILGCPGPPPPPPAVPVKIVCVPGSVEQPTKRHLGAIGVMLYVEHCPLTVEIWEIQDNSQGQFALKVNQNQIEAASEGLVACSANGRVAVRVGLTEPIRHLMAYSQGYKPPSQRGGGARDILVSVGPTFEQKVHHLVIDHALDGTVMGAVDTRPDGPPCQGADAASLQSAAAPPASNLRPAPAAPPQPTPVPIAAPVRAQQAREDGSIVHVVQPGDTIWAIGVAYNVHPYRIISQNQLDEILMAGGVIVPGQELLIRRSS